MDITDLISGVISAGAGTVSAYRDLRRRAGQPGQGPSGFNQVQTWSDGRTLTTERKITRTSGYGDAGVNANGDVYARSSGRGSSATAMHFVTKRTLNSSGNGT